MDKMINRWAPFLVYVCTLFFVFFYTRICKYEDSEAVSFSIAAGMFIVLLAVIMIGLAIELSIISLIDNEYARCCVLGVDTAVFLFFINSLKISWYMYNGSWENSEVTLWKSVFQSYSRIAVITYLAAIALFLLCMYQFIGIKYRVYKTYYWLSVISFAYLSTRSILGLLYSFHVISHPVSLLFAGDAASNMDIVCFALLIYSEIENWNIAKILEEQQGLSKLEVKEKLKRRIMGDGKEQNV